MTRYDSHTGFIGFSCVRIIDEPDESPDSLSVSTLPILNLTRHAGHAHLSTQANRVPRYIQVRTVLRDQQPMESRNNAASGLVGLLLRDEGLQLSLVREALGRVRAELVHLDVSSDAGEDLSRGLLAEPKLRQHLRRNGSIERDG